MAISESMMSSALDFVEKIENGLSIEEAIDAVNQPDSTVIDVAVVALVISQSIPGFGPGFQAAAITMLECASVFHTINDVKNKSGQESYANDLSNIAALISYRIALSPSPQAKIIAAYFSSIPFWIKLGHFIGQNAFLPNEINNKYISGFLRLITRDPLALDLDGDGIEVIGNSGGDVLFDHDNNGISHSTGWLSPDDGWLVRDLNSNGVIDSGREMFGDQTVLPDGSLATNGFEALAPLDSNNDGKIDVNDTAFAELKVWRDLNSDGISQAEELFTLTQMDIKSIDLAYTASTQTLAGGNSINSVGSFTSIDDQTHTAIK